MEGDVEVFHMEFPDGFGGGGGGLIFVSSMAEMVPIPNDGNDVFLDFEDPLPDGSAGAYLGKVNVLWDVSAPTSGGASVILSHIADSDQAETTICSIELNMLHLQDGYGDGQLYPGGSGVKTDFGIAPGPGHFVVRAQQFTDETPMEVSVQVELVKL
jgi:hypothetical protein